MFTLQLQFKIKMPKYTQRSSIYSTVQHLILPIPGILHQIEMDMSQWHCLHRSVNLHYSKHLVLDQWWHWTMSVTPPTFATRVGQCDDVVLLYGVLLVVEVRAEGHPDPHRAPPWPVTAAFGDLSTQQHVTSFPTKLFHQKQTRDCRNDQV